MERSANLSSPVSAALRRARSAWPSSSRQRAVLVLLVSMGATGCPWLFSHPSAVPTQSPADPCVMQFLPAAPPHQFVDPAIGMTKADKAALGAAQSLANVADSLDGLMASVSNRIMVAAAASGPVACAPAGREAPPCAAARAAVAARNACAAQRFNEWLGEIEEDIRSGKQFDPNGDAAEEGRWAMQQLAPPPAAGGGLRNNPSLPTCLPPDPCTKDTGLPAVRAMADPGSIGASLTLRFGFASGAVKTRVQQYLDANFTLPLPALGN